MGHRGDLILRGSPREGFQLFDAQTRKPVSGPLSTFDEVFSAAREYGADSLWRESVDDRGRPLGNLFRLPHLIQRLNVPG
jgi:hypothetical protein